MTKMKIYTSLHEHINQGFVWLKKDSLPARCVVKITYLKTKKSVFCEALQLEENFLQLYNNAATCSINNAELVIVMSSWYRARLGDLKTQYEYPLDITPANGWCGKIGACMDHPQIIVRVAVKLALLSIALGVVSVVVSVLSIAIVCPKVMELFYTALYLFFQFIN